VQSVTKGFFWERGGDVQKSPYFEGKESQKCANVLPYLDNEFRKGPAEKTKQDPEIFLLFLADLF
jgi:hypothetical protein